MGNIIFFDSARKGGTGKSKVSINTAVTMARDDGKTLLIEADYTNPNYISTYKQFIEHEENKNSYEWFKDILGHKIKMVSAANSPKTNGGASKLSKVEPKLRNYIQKTKIANLDILIGKKRQNDLLEQMVNENRDIFPLNPMIVESTLKDKFIKNVKKLSNEYDQVIIDGYAGYDYLTGKLFGIADKHIIVAENNEASAESVYNNMYDTINRIFGSMIDRSIAAFEISSNYNISTANKTGIQVYDEILSKAKDVKKELRDYDLKKCRKESISADEDELYAKFSKYSKDISALIEESEERRSKLTTLCVIINKVNSDILGKQRSLAEDNYKLIKQGLGEYGIRSITPGFEKNSDGGIIYYYKDFYKEDEQGLPLTYLNPNHNFSTQIKNLTNFIKADECWKKEI